MAREGDTRLLLQMGAAAGAARPDPLPPQSGPAAGKEYVVQEGDILVFRFAN